MLNNSTTKILIVEDESAHQLALLDILEASGKVYDILSVFNGKEALAIAKKELPDLILTDWEMPVMNGVDFILALKEDEQLADIPVIMCTGIMTSSEHLKTALEVGANDYVRKPFDAIEVNARINAMMSFSREHHRRIGLEKEVCQQKLEIGQEVLELHEQSLVVSKACLMHNSTYIEKILEDLADLSTQVSFRCHLKILALISKVKSDMARGSWEDIALHFEKIHTSFLVNLKRDFPDLTPNELELCMFLKLTMSRKEIQTVTGKSADALKKASQRLKKKLDVLSNDSLYQLIQSIN